MNGFAAQLHAGAINPNDREVEPPVFDPYFGERIRDATITTASGGYGAFSCKLACAPPEAAAWQHRLFWHLTASSYGARVYEGRLETVSRVDGGVGLQWIGYYNHLDDLLVKLHGTAADYDASAIVREVLASYAPMLSADTRFVTPPGFKLKALTYGGSDTAKQVLETALEGSDEADPVPYLVMVWDDRRAWLVPMERALVSWTIPAAALAGPPATTRDAQQLYTRAKTLFEQKQKTSTGATKRVQAEATCPDDPEVLAELGGNRRELAVTGGKSVGKPEDAVAWAQATLGEHLSGVTRFSLTVSGMVENHVGGLCEPWEIRAGQLVRLDADPNDERATDDVFSLAFVAETSWNVSTGQVTLQCEPIHGRSLQAQPVLASSGLARVA